ncbi:MAG: sulfatase-like hydrolase/transferase [Acidiferrobacterales bacterium]|nr:sulfatase-like hydrolase/transferase [Acidiferrobacterales bacterium]
MRAKLTLLSCVALLAFSVYLIGSIQSHHLLLLFLSLIAFLVFTLSSELRVLTVAGGFNTLIFGFYLLITVSFYLANNFTGNGITFDVVTQLHPDSLGAGFYAFESYHLTAILLIVLFLIVFIVAKYFRETGADRVPIWGKIATVVVMFALHPFTTSSGELVAKLLSSEKTELITQTLEKNKLSNQAIDSAKSEIDRLPNVLMIYLESLERTYFDSRYYTNLLTELESLTTQGDDFTGVKMPWGATHTIAGMIATQCGVPINTPRGGKHQHGDSDVYMPQAQCLNDITKALGYENLFYQGARLNFSNKGGFMRAHGYDEVKGLDELREGVPPNSIGPWGLHDSVLLGKVEKKLESLLNQKRENPFFFTLLSLDTHDAFGKNRYSKWCFDQGLNHYEGADHKIQHAVYCSDKLIARFIKQIQSKWGEELIIVMMSDHAAYPFNMGEKLKEAEAKKERNLLFTIFDSGNNPEVYQRQLSSLDLGATILGYITDHRLNTIGLGTNAYDFSRLNLIEQLGQSGLDQALQSSNLQLGKTLWKMPSFAISDININLEIRSVTIDSSRYAMPVALLIDDAGEIVDFYGKDAHERMALLKVSPRFVWAGECKYINTMLETNGADTDTCLTIGNITSNDYFSRVISDSVTLKYEDYLNFLSPDSAQANWDLANSRLYRYSGKDDIFDAIEIQPSSAVGDFAIVDISATMGIQANLVHHTLIPTMEERLNLQKRDINHFGYPNGNGLYLLEMKEGNLEVVYHWLTCTGNTKSHPSVNEVLAQREGSAALILTSARKVRCDNDNLHPYFADSPFEDATSLTQHQPYVAYLEPAEDTAFSVMGRPGGNVKLRLINKALFTKR